MLVFIFYEFMGMSTGLCAHACMCVFCDFDTRHQNKNFDLKILLWFLSTEIFQEDQTLSMGEGRHYEKTHSARLELLTPQQQDEWLPSRVCIHYHFKAMCPQTGGPHSFWDWKYIKKSNQPLNQVTWPFKISAEEMFCPVQEEKEKTCILTLNPSTPGGH